MKGGAKLPNVVTINQKTIKNKKELGQLIRNCRGSLSQSQLAARVGLSRSNMKYIEDGVNAPTAAIYYKLVRELDPDPNTHKQMDHLYMEIRNVPPPDVSNVFIRNEELVNAFRKIENVDLRSDQIDKLASLFDSFINESKEK